MLSTVGHRSLRRRGHIAIAVAGLTLLGPLVLVGTPLGPTAAAHDVSNDFVTRAGSQLLAAGQPYVFTGVNVYNANSDGWCAGAFSDAELAVELDEIGLGGEEHGVIRAWFFQTLATDKVTKGRDWSRMDRTLQIARAKGYKIIPTLTDQWGECGTDVTPTYSFKSEAWYTGGYTLPDPGMIEGDPEIGRAGYPDWKSYRDWVAEIVDRYKGDPTILAWQLINEAEVNPGGAFGGCEPGDRPFTILRAWAEDVSNLVRSIDANHLISLGTIGGGQCGTQVYQYRDVHALPNIDLCEVHDYTPNQAIPGDQWNGMSVRIQQCNELDKPLFVGEVGMWPDHAGGTFELRAAALRSKILAQRALGVDGHLAWAWIGTPSTLMNYDIGPGDPVLDELREPGSTFRVSSADDSDDGTCDATHCSLREAILAANGTPGMDVIAMAIPGPEPHVISPTAALPPITERAILDATAQPDYRGYPVVEVRGEDAPFGHGIEIQTTYAAVRGFVVHGFGNSSIRISGGGSSLITGNRIGTTFDGTVGAPRPAVGGGFVANAGIRVDASHGNRIGGVAGGDGNTISGNANGIEINGGSTGNVVLRNFIGTNVFGTGAVPNWNVGVRISQSSGNRVGAKDQGNVISGNYYGMDILGSGAFVGNNVVQGNYIGLAADGVTPLGNSVRGIEINQSGANQIGGRGAGEGNVISANGETGVMVFMSSDNVVEGNRIGTNAAGTAAVPNGVGVRLFVLNGATVGGVLPGAGNLISGNGTGIELGANVQGALVSGNLIGTDVTGLLDLGNGVGVRVATGNFAEASVTNEIGEAAVGNVIAGNSAAGVSFDAVVRPATVLRWNTIGLGVDGQTVIPNGVGVRAQFATHRAWIGTGDATELNVIAGNAGPGVVVGPTSDGVIVAMNEIHDNSGLGIDLGGDGVSANDGLDADGGPNRGQNFPVITVAVTSDDMTTIAGTLDSSPDLATVIYVYANDACDPSGHGEAGRFIGFVDSVVTDATGHGDFSLIVPALPIGTAITANAIGIHVGGYEYLDFDADSSELSACVTTSGEAATSEGTATEVALPTEAGDLVLTFDQVTAAGTTTVTSATTPPPLPGGFQTGDPPQYFQIETTASFSGQIEICIPYEDDAFSDESTARLLHYADPPGAWEDITSSLDTGANILCGLTDSLSPFALVERAYVFEGFQSPVDGPPIVNRAKAGSSIPVKFSLAGGDLGLEIFAPASPSSRATTCGSSAYDSVEQTVSAGSSHLSFDPVTNSYTYVWKTDKAWNGCRALLLTFRDGTTATALFQFGK